MDDVGPPPDNAEPEDAAGEPRLDHEPGDPTPTHEEPTDEEIVAYFDACERAVGPHQQSRALKALLNRAPWERATFDHLAGRAYPDLSAAEASKQALLQIVLACSAAVGFVLTTYRSDPCVAWDTFCWHFNGGQRTLVEELATTLTEREVDDFTQLVAVADPVGAIENGLGGTLGLVMALFGDGTTSAATDTRHFREPTKVPRSRVVAHVRTEPNLRPLLSAHLAAMRALRTTSRSDRALFLLVQARRNTWRAHMANIRRGSAFLRPERLAELFYIAESGLHPRVSRTKTDFYSVWADEYYRRPGTKESEK